MKKLTILTVLMVFIFGSVMAISAQTHNMKDEGKRNVMMGNNMDMSMMHNMMGGMGSQMVATEDGGVVVMCMGKLYKYDKNLKLVKEVEIPVDVKHMQEIHKKMTDGGMMGNMNMMKNTKPEKEKSK